MVYIEDIHSVVLAVDPIPHSVLAPASAPLTLERLAKRRTDTMGVRSKWSEDELDARCRDRLGQLLS